MQPYSDKHLTDAEIKKFVRETGWKLHENSGRYKVCDSIEEAKNFLEKNLDKTFYCKSICAHFTLDVHTAEHFFGKNRNSEDYVRRSKLLSMGLEILEESDILLVVDTISGQREHVVYYEILGRDTRAPKKIINAKLSEIKDQGKIFWTVVDIDCA